MEDQRSRRMRIAKNKAAGSTRGRFGSVVTHLDDTTERQCGVDCRQHYLDFLGFFFP